MQKAIFLERTVYVALKELTARGGAKIPRGTRIDEGYLSVVELPICEHCVAKEPQKSCVQCLIDDGAILKLSDDDRYAYTVKIW